MSRISEYQGKQLLQSLKIAAPRGITATTPAAVAQAAKKLGGKVVIKGQAWTTGRAALGLIKFAKTPAEASKAAKAILGTVVKGFVVDTVLVEEKLSIEREFYTGVIIDDTAKKPLIIFSSVGGTGIEEIAAEHPDKVARLHVDITEGLRTFQARNLIRKTGIGGKLQQKLAGVVQGLYALARRYEVRSAEINPLVLVASGDVVAADCRLTIDDNAVFRHPELGIDFAREIAHPPTELERIAYNVESKDYRGTFYFVQMAQGFKKGEGYVGFHGAGGGGSMMSMDSLTKRGLKLANFTDTSGNPPASKVYRAAKIILAQKNIDAYFGSGSGVASQEQFHSARGLVKAFLEGSLRVPVVIRLGGNQEDKAVQILEDFTKELPVPVKGYRKDDTADTCAETLVSFMEQVAKEGVKSYKPKRRPKPKKPYSWETVTGGHIVIDHARCMECESKICVEECVPRILDIKDGCPVLNITKEEAKRGKCIECLACEIDCRFKGNGATHIELPIPGLDAYLRKTAKGVSAKR